MSENNEKIVYLTEDEKESLIKAVEKRGYSFEKRDKAIILLAIYCGFRASEISNIRIKDINIQEREILCKRNQKSNSNVLKIIDEDVYTALLDYYEERDRDQYISEFLFLSKIGKPISRITLHKIINEYGENINLVEGKRHFQVLRDTRAIELLKSGLNLKEVQMWMGHKSHLSTLKYLRYYYDMDDAGNDVDYDVIYQKLKKGLKNGTKKDKKQSEGESDAGG